VSDGGGETFAARVPVVGVKRVALFYRRLHELGGVADAWAVRMLNGLPALVAHWKAPSGGVPSRVVIRVDVGEDGRVRVVHAIQARRKLTALSSPG